MNHYHGEESQATDHLARQLSTPRIGGLDFLRAQAVFLVMIGHAAEAVPAFAPLLGVVSGLGVKIFFVLSGFLITKILLKELNLSGEIDFKAFYVRRIARLMPAFYLYLLIAIAAVTFRGNPLPWDAIAASMLYVTNYYQAFTGAQPNLVAHCWSLAVEEQFYFIWPICCYLLFYKRLDFIKYLIAFIVGVWSWRLFLLLFAGASADYLYRALDTRADELVVGCLLAVLCENPAWRSRLSKAMMRPATGMGLALSLYALTYLDGQSTTFKYAAGYMIEPFIIALLIVLTIQASNSKGWRSRLLNASLVTHMGKVSYGMYLFHGLVMHAVQKAADAQGLSFWLGVTLAMSATYALAALSFKWFETPMNRWIQSLGSSK